MAITSHDRVGKARELGRRAFDEQVRSEKRKAGGSLTEASASGTLEPRREIVTPHAVVKMKMPDSRSQHAG